jgi:putative transposase
MKLSVHLKLIADKEAKDSLLKTVKSFNAACNDISKVAFESKQFNKFGLQKLVYHTIRDSHSLSSQLCIRAIAKVANSYKLDKMVQRKFKDSGAITYDTRILSFNLKEKVISISTIDGRLKIQFVCGERQFSQLQSQKGESDLAFRDGKFYLLATCDATEKDTSEPTGFLGVDRGVNNIATDSLGNNYSGSYVISNRKKYAKMRRTLQKVDTKSAKRKLAKSKRKESRFAKDVNHCVSKKIVETAQRHNLGISIEDLSGISKRITVRKGNRYIRQSWSFNDLEQKIIYKAKLNGVEVRKIDPRNTSRECFACSHISKSNRKTQSLFLCKVCGHTDHADKNAARVISRRATINWPIVGSI